MGHGCWGLWMGPVFLAVSFFPTHPLHPILHNRPPLSPTRVPPRPGQLVPASCLLEHEQMGDSG